MSVDSAKILSTWDTLKDSCTDNPRRAMKWVDVSPDNQKLPYVHSRGLPLKVAGRATSYIAELTKGYPFQIRYTMAIPLWERFCSEWCETGDTEKSLMSI